MANLNYEKIHATMKEKSPMGWVKYPPRDIKEYESNIKNKIKSALISDCRAWEEAFFDSSDDYNEGGATCPVSLEAHVQQVWNNYWGV